MSETNRPDRTSRAVGESRRRDLLRLLRKTGTVTVAELEDRFGVSAMTARRDLAELERRGVARRIHGGAVLSPADQPATSGAIVFTPERMSIDGAPDAESRPLLAESRRRAIGDLLQETGAVTVAELQTRFGVSAMTARRDLDELERQGVARRAHGGAVLPLASGHEDSFAQRLERDAPAKERLAHAAVDLVATGDAIFLDSSTTSYFVARRILEVGTPATIITNCLAIMELVRAHGGSHVELIGIGGSLRPLTRSFVGPYAVHTINGHFADRMFLSVKGLSPDGVLTDADPLETEVKRAMIRHAAEPILLIDESKLNNRGLNAIVPIDDLAGVIVDNVRGSTLAGLRATGVSVKSIGA